METSQLNTQQALSNLTQIKKILNETSFRVSKIYLFFYGAAFIYSIQVFLSLSYIFPIHYFRNQTVLINNLYYFSAEARSYYMGLGTIQGLTTLFYPILLLLLFSFIKFKSIPKSNRFAHRILHIWTYGCLIIYFGINFFQFRLFSSLSSYLESLLPLDVETYNLINEIVSGLNFISPFIIGLILIFIYLMMNLMTNNKLFLIGAFLNLVTYSCYLIVLPITRTPFVINDILNMKISSILCYQLFYHVPFLLLILNLLIIGRYFKKMYHSELVAYEN